MADGQQKASITVWPLTEKISQLLFQSLVGNWFWIHENSQVEKTLGWGVDLFFSSLSPVSRREQLNKGEPRHVLMKVRVYHTEAPLGHGTCPLESETWIGNTNDPYEAGPSF